MERLRIVHDEEQEGFATIYDNYRLNGEFVVENLVEPERVDKVCVEYNQFLTDADAYFIRTNCPRGMVGYDRKIMDIQPDNDFDTYNARYKKYERYSFKWTDPHGLYGSAGA